jgi:hypothetical protein
MEYCRTQVFLCDSAYATDLYVCWFLTDTNLFFVYRLRTYFTQRRIKNDFPSNVAKYSAYRKKIVIKVVDFVFICVSEVWHLLYHETFITTWTKSDWSFLLYWTNKNQIIFSR